MLWHSEASARQGHFFRADMQKNLPPPPSAASGGNLTPSPLPQEVLTRVSSSDSPSTHELFTYPKVLILKASVCLAGLRFAHTTAASSTSNLEGAAAFGQIMLLLLVKRGQQRPPDHSGCYQKRVRTTFSLCGREEKPLHCPKFFLLSPKANRYCQRKDLASIKLLAFPHPFPFYFPPSERSPFLSKGWGKKEHPACSLHFLD